MQRQTMQTNQHSHKNDCECQNNDKSLAKEFDSNLNVTQTSGEKHQQIQNNLNEDQDNQPNQEQVSGRQQEQQDFDSQQEKNSKWKKIEQPEKAVKLFMIDFAHCDAKKCSGKKLERFKLLTTLDKKKKFKGIVLSAFGKKQSSLEDLEYAQKYGVCVVDCSWNRIEETREFRFKHQRKLPFVTAGNPVNYGKPYQLSCAEALATALCTIGYNDQAEYIMSKFGWSDGFWSLNPLIENYSKCKTLEQLKKESKAIEEKGTQKFQRNYDLSDPESSGDEN